MSRRKFDRKAIAKAVRAGETTVAVAKRLGACIATVYNACRVEGVDIEAFDRARRKKRDKDIAEVVKAGAAPIEVAQQFGVSIGVVYDACRMHGVTFLQRSLKPLNALTFAILAELLNTTESRCVIARSFCVSRQYVEQLAVSAEQAGIKLASPDRHRGKE